MTALAAALLAGASAGAAVALAQGASPASARRRLAGPAAGGNGGRRTGASRRDPPPGVPVRLLAAAGALALGFAVGGLIGLGLAGAAVALGDRHACGGRRREARRRSARIGADLPGAADLFAACLAAGSAPPDAAEAVAEAVGGPVGDALRRVVALLRLGGDPVRCWLGLGADPELAPLGRAVARAVESGTSLAPVVAAEAARSRLVRRVAAEAASARVGVYATAPLGLCFLPAFVLIGIVPVVIGVGSGVLS